MMELLDALFHSENPAYHTSGLILLRILLILACTVLISKLVGKATRDKKRDKLYWKFLHNVIAISIYVGGCLLALGQLPQFNSGVETLLAGSGIAALALSLAAQESLGNAINGIVLTVSKPFEVGDRIKLVDAGITGYIEDITLRHTVIRTFMNSRIIVPNSTINKDMIENSNFQQARASAFIDVIITYDSDMEKAMEIMSRVVGEHPKFVDTRSPEEMGQPKVPVYVRALSVYGVELRASMWTEHIGLSFDACSEVRRQLKHAFDEAGIKFATAMPAALPPS
ncbi:MAG TPA: mechanosensitive ion channel family protein [Clostridiales bacterium]|nr:mechanosensitive ion channel family protein [Clostridiales bacterium]